MKISEQLQQDFERIGDIPPGGVFNAKALISIVQLLESIAAAPPATVAGQERHASLLKESLDAMAPFARLMGANEKGGQKLKPDMVVIQIGEAKLTGDDIKGISDLYMKLWAAR